MHPLCLTIPTRLGVSLTRITDLSVQVMAREGRKLQSVNLGGCPKLSNVGVGILASNAGPRLLTLNLGGCKLTNYDIQDLAKVMN